MPGPISTTIPTCPNGHSFTIVTDSLPDALTVTCPTCSTVIGSWEAIKVRLRGRKAPQKHHVHATLP